MSESCFVDSDGCEVRPGERWVDINLWVFVHPRAAPKACLQRKTLDEALPPGLGIAGTFRVLDQLLPDFECWIAFEEEPNE